MGGHYTCAIAQLGIAAILWPRIDIRQFREASDTVSARQAVLAGQAGDVELSSPGPLC